jgi:hypothetical protein
MARARPTGPKTRTTPQSTQAADDTIVTLPIFHQVPECLFPLRSKAGRKEYETLARLLFERGRLTAEAHRVLSSYALQFENIQLLMRSNKPVSANLYISLDRRRREIGLNDLDKPIAAPEGSAPNKFAGTGFASRRR